MNLNRIAVIIIRETASGIEAKIINISQGHLLFSKLADQAKNLDQTIRPLNLAREQERREKGQALTYVFIDWGLYPNALFQVEFLEQWGPRNQHLSGFTMSFVEPVGSIGGTYHYLMPGNRKLNLGASLFITLDGLTKTSQSSTRSPWSIVSQAMVQYALSGNYAIFGIVNSKGTVSIGITFLNPVLFPFLL